MVPAGGACTRSKGGVVILAEADCIVQWAKYLAEPFSHQGSVFGC